MTNDGTEFWKYCAHCGAELGLDDWPPVVELVSDGAETIIHSFCDDGCRANWFDAE